MATKKGAVEYSPSVGQARRQTRPTVSASFPNHERSTWRRSAIAALWSVPKALPHDALRNCGEVSRRQAPVLALAVVNKRFVGVNRKKVVSIVRSGVKIVDGGVTESSGSASWRVLHWQRPPRIARCPANGGDRTDSTALPVFAGERSPACRGETGIDSALGFGCFWCDDGNSVADWCTQKNPGAPAHTVRAGGGVTSWK